MTMIQFPAALNSKIKQEGYGREDSARFAISEPASGPHYAQLLSDDAPSFFNLRMDLRNHDAQFFRTWLNSNNFAVLTGAEFEIKLMTEDGMTTQVASFLPDGIPQVTNFAGGRFTYSMRVIVRKVTGPSAGFEDLIIGISNMGGSPLLQRIVNNLLSEI